MPWLRARLDGEAADAPIGAEHVVAEVNAQREEFDVTSEDGRRETEIGLGKLRMGLQLGDIEDRIARLKEMLGTDDHSAEDLAELSRLQRERANLRDRIQRAGD